MRPVNRGVFSTAVAGNNARSSSEEDSAVMNDRLERRSVSVDGLIYSRRKSPWVTRDALMHGGCGEEMRRDSACKQRIMRKSMRLIAKKKKKKIK